MNSVAPIYEYESPRQFLLDRVGAIQKCDPQESLRSISKKMGMKSHTLLLMFLQGKRELRVKHAPAIAKGLSLTSPERLYLQALIQYDNAEDIEEKKLCQLWLSELNPNGPSRRKEIDDYEILSNWVHMAILSLSESHDFNPDPQVIAARLGQRVTTVEVRAAIERMKSAGLMQFLNDGSGKFVPSQNHVTTQDDVLNAGARKYHQEVMKLATDAIEHLPVERREFQSFAVSVPNTKIPLVKEMIRKFCSQVSKAIGPEFGDEVYQCSIQFFQLTESRERIGRLQDEGVDTGTNNEKPGVMSCSS